MFDHAYSRINIARLLESSDIGHLPPSAQKVFRENAIRDAMHAVSTLYGGINPIMQFHLRKKSAYRVKGIHNQLVIRKLDENLDNSFHVKFANRFSIVSNLSLLLSEGVPYRIYRLDVSKFYESFQKDHIIREILSCASVSPKSRDLLITILNYYWGMGGIGVPRGMRLGALLSEYLMRNFDKSIQSNQYVYYYSRYVDDIIIVTSSYEKKEEFLKLISLELPQGLLLNKKKCKIREAIKPAPQKRKDRVSPSLLFEIDYLGYNFKVYDPGRLEVNIKMGYRRVDIDIASIKINKIKTRIARSVRDYLTSPGNNERLLIDRIKFLSSNFYIYNKKSKRRNLAGIYYGFPSLNVAEGLEGLNKFLRQVLSSGFMRVNINTKRGVSSQLRRKILSNDFLAGHQTKKFTYFSSQRMAEIQECWIYE